MSNKIWQNFGAFKQTDKHKAAVQDEFQEDLPFDMDDKGLLDSKTPRRDFLKYLGFSTAAAGLAASCEMPVKKAIPYTNKPETITPGVANYYATTYTQDGDVQSVVAKVRDGRPIKIEGNELCPITKGSTSARAQASVLDLYDTHRLRFPAQVKEGELVELPTFEAADKLVMQAMAGLAGKPVLLVSNTITSPSSRQLVAEFLGKMPAGSRHVAYDAISHSAMAMANELSYGKKAIPSYHFDKAEVIVSLDADFLANWLSPVEFAKQYAKGRKINEANPALSKHFQFESIMSMTGANADERYTHKPSQAGAVAAALLGAVRGQKPAVADAAVAAGVGRAADALRKANGKALVVSGYNDINIQLVVNAINEAIGAGGNTINWGVTSHYKMGDDAAMAQAVADLNAGTFGGVMFINANPAYDYAGAEKLIAGLAKTKLKISFNTRLDETTQYCDFVFPDHHYLESWGDAEPKSGHASFIQPTIHPLFKTRQWQDSLLRWSGGAAPVTAATDSTGKILPTVAMGSGNDYLSYLKRFWMQRLGNQDAWDRVLRDGLIVPAEAPVSGSAFNGAAAEQAISALAATKGGGDWEVVLYHKVSIGSGSQATNPWLQELPDPVTKATWDNYAVISAAAAKELLDIDLTNNGDIDSYEVNPAKPVLKITVNGKEMSLPAMIVPGTEKHTIGIALGYGRSAKVGVASREAGQNAYPLTTIGANGMASFGGFSATVATTGDKYEIAQNQVHGNYEGRMEVVKETSLATFAAHKTIFKDQRDALVHDYAKKEGDYRNEGSLYDPRLNDRPGMHWGLSVDLNSCNGCGACVVACSAENNIPVVGKTEVLRGHDMHWMRIDRYYVTDPANPDAVKDVVFMPMMCQHCDNAPCENVCPVAATNHSTEGLNQMTYNRCIGTRYCANNCPYKVRRFNWADYTGADSFPDNQIGHVSDTTLDMNDDLTRMVLNPDVTVRSRGVIEKCSFCVQRLQAGKLEAKKQGRPVRDGEIKTACQQACPTEALVFGDVNDKQSAIRSVREHSPLRMYYALEQIHVLPNVSYLAKVRNTDEVEEVAPAHAEGEHAAEAAH